MGGMLVSPKRRGREDGFLRDSVQMAAHEVPWRSLDERRLDVRARLEPIGRAS
jgi:hypothetical protein